MSIGKYTHISCGERFNNVQASQQNNELFLKAFHEHYDYLTKFSYKFNYFIFQGQTDTSMMGRFLLFFSYVGTHYRYNVFVKFSKLVYSTKSRRTQ